MKKLLFLFLIIPFCLNAQVEGGQINTANASRPGVVSTTPQTISGQKTIAMASSGAVTQNLILDNTATAAVSSATSMAQSVAGLQRCEVRTTLTEIVGGGADYAKTEIRTQDGGALEVGVLVDMKNAGVDNVTILPSKNGALTSARRNVQPYGTISVTGSQTLTAGYEINYLTDGGLGVATYSLTFPPTADMLDGELYRVVCNFAPGAGTSIQFVLNSGQTFNGASPGSIGFVTGGSGQVNKNNLFQFVAGDWRFLSSN